MEKICYLLVLAVTMIANSIPREEPIPWPEESAWAVQEIEEEEEQRLLEQKNQEITEKAQELETNAPKQPQENSALVGYEDRKSWWFKRNFDHVPPTAQQEISINQYDAYYLGDTSQKVIYLTFDEGYENGYTSKILDILKKKDVKAAFFVTKSYIESEPDLIRRMAEEGHIVGNHSVTHSDFTTLGDEEILWELEECAKAYKEVTGQDMPFYFRPPEGVYSIRTLEKTKEAGFKTIFWSFAYQDWDVNNQPGKEGAYKMVMDCYHNGAIMLLHAVSQSNTEALEDIIDSLREQGYTFATLEQLPE